MFLLHLLISSTVEKSAPVRLQYKCPVCEKHGVTGEAHDQAERYKTMLFIPFHTERTTWITCTSCHSLARAEIPVAELLRQPPGEIYRYVQRSLPPLIRVFLIAGLPVAFIPVFGFAYSIPAMSVGKQYGGWARGLAITGMALSILGCLVLLLALVLPEPAYKKPTFAPIRQTAPAKP